MNVLLAQVNFNGLTPATFCNPGSDLFAISLQAIIATAVLLAYILVLIIIFYLHYYNVINLFI